MRVQAPIAARARSRMGSPFGGGGPRPRLAFDFSGFAAGALSGALPAGLAYACATSGRTCRTGATTLATGIGADTPAIEAIVTAAGLRRGLLIEPASTNKSPVDHDVSTLTSAGTSDSYGSTTTGPDGATAARSVTVLSGGNSKFQNATLSAATSGIAFAAWCQSVSGSARVQPCFAPSGAGINVCQGATVDTTWTRVVASTGFSSPLVPSTTTVFGAVSGDQSTTPFGDAAMDHGPAYMCFLQLEAVPFATSWVAHGTSRAGVTLTYPRLAAAASGGRIAMEIAFVPLGASIGAASPYPGLGYSQRLWTAAGDATTFLELDGDTGQVRASVAGSTTLSEASPLFSSSDYVELYIEVGNGPTLCFLRSNGAGMQLFGWSPTSLPAIPAAALGGVLALCHDPSAGAQLAAAVSHIRFW